jgi:hypothetical protein
MATLHGLDFSALVAQRTPLTSRSGKVYDLRDDIPMETIMYGVVAKNAFIAMAQLDPDTPLDDAKQQFSIVRKMVLEAFGALVRYSLPGVTDDELAREFSVEEMVMATTFFTNLAGERFAERQQNISTAREQLMGIPATTSEQTPET